MKEKEEEEKTKLFLEMQNGFDPKLMNRIEEFDGFTLYKHKHTSNKLVKQYCYNLEQDYVEYKYMICAYSQGLN